MTELTDIRRVVVSLVLGRSEEYGMCRHWTSRHKETACSEGLGPWLYKSLGDPAQAGLDPGILAAFQRDYRRSAVSCLYREAALRKLFGVFNACDIPVILLKGCYLGSFVYQDPALRPMSDVDLLVREDDFGQAGRELERLGFRPVSQPNQGDEDQLSRSPIEYQVLSPVPEFIDLHQGIQSMDYYRFPSAVVWEEAAEKELYGCQVFCLSAELNFIHLALHIFDHRGSLRDWVDLATMVRTVDLDWDRLMSLARSLGAVRPLFWVFRELGQNWGTHPPAIFSASLASYVPGWWEDRVIRHRFRYLWRLAARISRLDGWRARLHYVGVKILPPPDETGRRPVSSYTSHVKSKISFVLQLWRRS